MLRASLLIFSLVIGNCTIASAACEDVEAGCNPLVTSLLYRISQTTVPKARNLYVTHSGSTALNAFAISEPGHLSLSQIVNLPDSAEQLAISADNRFLFAAVDAPTNLVVPIAISDSGALSILTPIGGFTNPTGVSISSGNRLFVSDRDGNIVNSYAIDGSGNIGLIGSTAGSMVEPRSIAIHPGGRFVHVALENGSLGSALLSLSSTGAPTWVSNTNIAGTTNVFGLTYDHSGNYLFVPSYGGSQILFCYQINQLDGSLSLVHSQNLPGPPRYGIVIHPALPIIYVAYELVSPLVESYAISPGGSVSLKESISLPSNGTRTLLIDKLGLALYSINSNGNIYGITLNPGNGSFGSVTGPFFSDTNPMGGALLHRSESL